MSFGEVIYKLIYLENGQATGSSNNSSKSQYLHTCDIVFSIETCLRTYYNLSIEIIKKKIKKVPHE